MHCDKKPVTSSYMMLMKDHAKADERCVLSLTIHRNSSSAKNTSAHGITNITAHTSVDRTLIVEIARAVQMLVG